MDGGEGGVVSPKAKKPRRAPKSKATAAVASNGSMYLGSNVHYDDQGRLLCTSSVKMCNSRPVVGWGFCKTHILEDKTAPFKQCEATTKGRQCTLVVAIGEDSRYCGIHASIERKAAASQSTTTSVGPSSSDPAPTAPQPLPSALKKEHKSSASAFIDMNSDGEAGSDTEDYSSFWSPSLSDSISDTRFASSIATKLFPSIMHLSKGSLEGRESLEIGHPQFSLPAFLAHRSTQLTQHVRYYRMKMVQLQLAYERFVMEEARERVRIEETLLNEEECLHIDHQKRMKTLEKLYRRKHEEEMKRKEGSMEDFGSVAFGSGAAGGAGMSSHEMDPHVNASPRQIKGRLDLTHASSTSTSQHHQSSSSPRGGRSAASSLPGASSAHDSPAASSSGGGGRASKLEKTHKCESKECAETAVPLSPFCWAHILLDPSQKLFVSCAFDPTAPISDSLVQAGLALVPCSYPVIRGGPSPPLCAFHSDILNQADDEGGDIDADEDEDEED